MPVSRVNSTVNRERSLITRFRIATYTIITRNEIKTSANLDRSATFHQAQAAMGVRIKIKIIKQPLAALVRHFSTRHHPYRLVHTIMQNERKGV